MCGGFYGWTTRSLDFDFIFMACLDAGIPDVPLQKRQVGDASCSIFAQTSCLNTSFSGPCS